MITITYVTVTFNAESLLQRTLDSVLCQDYRHINHLIVDGASTDGTMKKVADYAARSNAADNGHHIHVISEPDSGIYDAMNKALRSATGDYVCFLNAGDFLPSADTASRIVASISPNLPHLQNLQNLPAVLYGHTDIVDNQGHFIRHRRLQPPEKLTWRSFRQGMLVCHQAFYARTDLATATPYNQQYRYSADVDWCIRIMKAAEQQQLPLHNLHMLVANYTEEGQTTRHHRQSLMERYRIMQHHYGPMTTLAMHIWFAVRALLQPKNT
ncbi:MAG: glycosyltransferase [Prevotella sp.]|nr:glycosyltransferase [Prevotella sp.]